MNGPRTPHTGPEDETIPEAGGSGPNDAELMLTLGSSSSAAVTEFDELLDTVDDDDEASR
jgi:hypothetical protein